MAELRTCLALARASAAGYLARPLLFAAGAIGTALAVGVEAAGIVLLLDRFHSIGGYDTGQVLVLLGIAECGLGIALAVTNRLFPQTFAALLRAGEFDGVLTRPTFTLTWMLSSDVQPREGGRFLAGLVVLLAGAHRHVRWTPTLAGIAVLAVLCCTAVIVALSIVGAASTFATGQASEFVAAFTFGGIALAEYPLQVFGTTLRVAFSYVIPVALTVYVPALWLLNRQGPALDTRVLLAAVPLAAGVSLTMAACLWNRSVNRYRDGR
ncbi:MAG: ABC transporter permease [Mycobacteriales bacterium]